MQGFAIHPGVQPPGLVFARHGGAGIDVPPSIANRGECCRALRQLQHTDQQRQAQTGEGDFQGPDKRVLAL